MSQENNSNMLSGMGVQPSSPEAWSNLLLFMYRAIHREKIHDRPSEFCPLNRTCDHIWLGARKIGGNSDNEDRSAQLKCKQLRWAKIWVLIDHFQMMMWGRGELRCHFFRDHTNPSGVLSEYLFRRIYFKWQRNPKKIMAEQEKGLGASIYVFFSERT